MSRDVVLRSVAYRVLAATSDRQPDPDRCQGQSLSGHSHSHLPGHTLRLERSPNQRSETDMARVSGNDLTIGPIRPISGAPRPPTDSTDAMGKQLPGKALAHPRELARFEPARSETLAGFADRCLQPLGHECEDVSITTLAGKYHTQGESV